MLNKIFAQVKKDFLILASYKLAFLSNFLGVLASILTYFFIDKLFGHRLSGHLTEFGVNYFSYVLLSMAFFGYIGVGVGSFSSRIRAEQMQGTLESLLLCPVRIETILAGMALWNFIFATLDVLFYIFLGSLLFGINFSGANLISVLTILIFTIVCFSSLGILSACFILVLKRGNPLSWLINTFEGVIGGVYFPVAVMPPLLQVVARILPITYAIRAMELAVYRGYNLCQLKNELLFLVIFSLLLLPTSILAFKFSLRKARRQGTLVQY
ncbi:MAG: ABC transporter permease [Candidatus Omnitrophica bacterium]|nr:ABC transporter permease [Candidatus Omnitrophota bacterium]MBU1924993.1 ABC transporter permease [Candidatus Omnitrophota bacterium]MBU2063399.1 ABC transporter permease [Candidatus Omnitrophota bacterium]